MDTYSFGIVMLQLIMKSKGVGKRNSKANQGKMDPYDETLEIVERARFMSKTRDCVNKELHKRGCRDDKLKRSPKWH